MTLMGRTNMTATCCDSPVLNQPKAGLFTGNVSMKLSIHGQLPKIFVDLLNPGTMQTIIENITGTIITIIMTFGAGALVLLLWWQVWQYTLVS